MLTKLIKHDQVITVATPCPSCGGAYLILTVASQDQALVAVSSADPVNASLQFRDAFLVIYDRLPYFLSLIQ